MASPRAGVWLRCLTRYPGLATEHCASAVRTYAGVQTTDVVPSGAGASGQADYNILPPFIPMAHQFGAIRVWMGFPWTGSFDATQIVVTRQK